ncbi:hypothetical protein MF628_08545 [Paenibacillus polymyxa]|nr:hypothetical protein [Paenibacillus polymyxa]WDZ63366.1 hypothetical protein MF628_08545 [Paenibacillus polymyxa]
MKILIRKSLKNLAENGSTGLLTQSDAAPERNNRVILLVSEENKGLD